MEIQAKMEIKLDEAFNNLLQSNFDELALNMSDLKDLFNDYAKKLLSFLELLSSQQSAFSDMLTAAGQDIELIKKAFAPLNKKLDDHFTALQRQIQNLADGISAVKTELDAIKDLINGYREDFDKINPKLDSLADSLADLSTFLKYFRKEMQDSFKSLNDRLDGFGKSLDDFLKDFADLVSLVQKISDTVEALSTAFDSFRKDYDKVIPQIKNNVDTIKGETGRLLGGQDAILFELTTGFATIEKPFVNVFLAIGGAVTAIAAHVTAEGVAVVAAINKTLKPIATVITTLPQTFEDILKKKLDELQDNLFQKRNDYWKDHKEEIITDITEDVCANIVGDSYARWDSQSNYYPILIFKFINKDKLGSKTHSQIAVCLPVKSDEVTEELIAKLKLKAEATLPFEYNAGNLRCNYVSVKKTFKTTIYVSAKEVRVEILKKVCSIIEEDYVANQCSFTEKAVRQSLTRRSQGFMTISLNPPDPRLVNLLSLKKVYLQVKGLFEQIKIYSKPIA